MTASLALIRGSVRRAPEALLGALLVLAGVACVHLMVALGVQPVAPLLWPLAGALVAAGLGGVPAACGALVAESCFLLSAGDSRHFSDLVYGVSPHALEFIAAPMVVIAIGWLSELRRGIRDMRACVRRSEAELCEQKALRRTLEEKETSLRRSSELLQLALLASRVSFWETDLTSGKVHLSEGWADLVGAEPGETRTSLPALMAITHPDDLPRAVQLSTETMKGVRDEYCEEHRVRTRAGEWRWVLSRGRVTERDAQGRALGMIGTNVDISDHMRAEIALAENEARFRQLTALSSDWYWEQDEHLRFVSFSGPRMASAPFSCAELLGRTRWDDPRQCPVSGDWTAHKTGLEARRPFRDLLLRVDVEGKPPQYLGINGDPIFDADGRFTGYRGTVSNVTERVASQQALAESEERFRSLTALSSDWYWEQDEQYRFTRSGADSPYPPDLRPRDLIGRARWELEDAVPEVGDWDAHRAVLDARQPFYDYEFRRTSLDGKVRYVRISGEPRFDAQCRFRGYRGVGKDITERKLAEQAVRRHERELHVLMDAMPAFITHVDREERFRFANRAFAALFNRAAAEVVGRRRDEILSAETLARMNPFMARALGGETVSAEIVLPGTDRTLAVNFVPELDADGAVAGVYSMHVDVSDAKRAQRALAASEARFRSLTALSSDWYWEQDPELRFLLISPGFDAQTTMDSSEYLGRRRWDIDGLEPLEGGWESHKADVLAQKPYRDLMLRRRTGDGSERYFTASGEPVHDIEGRFLGYRGVGRDVTGIMRAEQALAASEARFRALYDETPSMFFTLSPAGMVLSVNEFGASYLGFAPAELLGRSVLEVFVEEDRPVALQRVAGCLAEVGSAHNWELRKRRKDGSVIWVKETARAVIRSDGTPVILIVCEDISEHKRAQQALAESEARFRGLTALSSDWYWEQDEHFNFTFVSGGVETTSSRPADYLGKTRWHAATFSPVTADWAEHRALLERHEPFRDFEMRRRDGDGAPLWVSISGEPIYDAGGRFRGYRGVGRNITERKRAEALVQEDLHFINQLLEAMPNPVFFKDMDGRYLGCNRAFEHLIGVSRERLIGMHVHDLSPRELADVYAEADRRLLDNPGSQVYEGAVRAADGSRREVMFYKATFTRADGTLGGLVGSIADITPRVEAERQARAADALLRDAVEHLHESVCITDAEDRIVVANRLFRQLNAEVTEWIGLGRRFSEHLREGARLGLFPDATGRESEWLQERLLWRGAGPTRHEVRRQDGIWLEVGDQKLPDGSTVCFALDITKRKQDEAALRDANRDLEQRVRERTVELQAAVKEMEAFSYSVSHDLRTPLGALIGFTDLLQMTESTRLTDEGRKLLGYVESNANRMAQLIEGLLEFARLGRRAMVRRQVAMAEIAGEVLQELQLESQVTLSFGQLPDCVGDPLLLKQVWANLCGNALKYSRQADRPRIEIGWDTARRAYFVSDNGVGFNMAQADKLFGMFERLHSDIEFEGCGIGLAICERIVTLHGGAIWARGDPGKGATFWFNVPQAESRLC